MFQNFISGIVALSSDTQLFFSKVFAHSLFTGFLSGCIITIIIVGFILSEDPQHIPTMLRHSCPEGFKKIQTKNHMSVCVLSYTKYEKIYLRVRVLFFGSMLAFCVMVTTILLKKS